MTDDTITIDGEHSTAEIKTTDVDEACIEQVREMVDHEAFQAPIKVMPDAHAGAGAVIGFTMPLRGRVCPNTVGVDIGCGVTAARVEKDDWRLLEDDPEAADRRIRERIPLGRETHADLDAGRDYDIESDFPWGDVRRKAETLNSTLDGLGLDGVEPLFEPDEYVDELCGSVGYDRDRLTESLGSLGGGNHFVEVSRSVQTGDRWVVVHSGSRGIGLSIAEYWQERAHELQDGRPAEARERLRDLPDWSYRFDLDETDSHRLLAWLRGDRGDFKDTDEIRRRRDGEAIGELVGELREAARVVRDRDAGHDLDYLTDQFRSGYLRDMVFAQTYAEESRRLMAEYAADALGADIRDSVVSTHNYIDFEDGVIRKGATRAHKGERAVIPFNMRDGAVLVRGLGDPDWNWSAPHGAGRLGSRRWAEETFSVAEYAAQMSGVYSSSVGEATLDEAPMAYKNTDSILDAMRETVKVEETLSPIINIKAEQ